MPRFELAQKKRLTSTAGGRADGETSGLMEGTGAHMAPRTVRVQKKEGNEGRKQKCWLWFTWAVDWIFHLGTLVPLIFADMELDRRNPTGVATDMWILWGFTGGVFLWFCYAMVVTAANTRAEREADPNNEGSKGGVLLPYPPLKYKLFSVFIRLLLWADIASMYTRFYFDWDSTWPAADQKQKDNYRDLQWGVILVVALSGYTFVAQISRRIAEWANVMCCIHNFDCCEVAFTEVEEEDDDSGKMISRQASGRLTSDAKTSA